MHVVLVQLPFPLLHEEPRHLSPPLGLAYMAATATLAGHSAVILDSLLEGYHNVWSVGANRKAYGLNPSLIANRIAGLKPDLIGLSCLFSTQDEILRLVVKAVRSQLPAIPIVLGGTHPTVFAQDFVADVTGDFVIRGEGDHSLVQLLAALISKSGFDSVSGLTWCSGNTVFETPVQRIADMDSLPFPSRRSLDLAAYANIGILHGESRRDVMATTIVTSRGCPARCTFCSIHPVWGHRFRAKSPARVLAEINELYSEFGVRHLLIEDDNFTFDQERAAEILTGIAELWPDLTWSAPNGVAVWRLDAKVIKLMAKTGCRRLSLAVESGCNRTLEKVIKKPLNLEQVQTAVAECRKAGIRTTAFFVIGTPGETQADMLESMRYAYHLDVDTLSVMTAVPLPGSPLYDQAMAAGWIEKDAHFTSFTTRNPILTTSEFDPQWVDRLARLTMLRHAMKHPRAYLERVQEKVMSSPISTFQAISRTIAVSVQKGGWSV